MQYVRSAGPRTTFWQGERVALRKPQSGMVGRLELPESTGPGKGGSGMDWPFLIILVVMVPIVFLPPAFMLLRPRSPGGRRRLVDQ